MKQTVKRIVDLAMIILLPILMAEVLIGQQLHEWLGTGMLALFIAHHILNFGWWKSFFKGSYTPQRAFYTTIVLLLLLDMAALFASGVMMSGFVFSFLHISGGMILARQLHLFASYWGFILMSAHLGLHMEQFFGLGRKMFHLSEKNAVRTWVLRSLAVLAAGYGIFAFFTQQIPGYLFLQTHFVMFDETKAAVVYFAETIAMMVLFAAVAHYLNKLLCKVKKSEKKNGYGWKAISFAIPVIAAALVIVKLNLPEKTEPWQNVPTVDSSNTVSSSSAESSVKPSQPIDTTNDGFVLIRGGSFEMGSPSDEPLSVHYSGGSGLSEDIAEWLGENNIQ